MLTEQVVWNFGEIPADSVIEECFADARDTGEEAADYDCPVEEMTAAELRRMRKNGFNIQTAGADVVQA